MVACESPALPDSPDLIHHQSQISPWKPTMNPKTHSFGDIFREPPPPLFHPPPLERTTSMPSSSSGNDLNPFSHKKSESLQLCTEGLGFESFDNVEDLQVESSSSSQPEGEAAKMAATIRKLYMSPRRMKEFRRANSFGGGGYPPPIPSISVSGKPWVCFKTYRQDGRVVLKEEWIPTLEMLHASREDGRLRLDFVHRPEQIEVVGHEKTETTNKEDTEDVEEEERFDDDDD